MEGDSVEFCGLKYYPLGHATLSRQKSELVVSRMKSGMNGFSVDTGNALDVSIQLAPVDITEDISFAVTYNMTDHSNYLRTAGQWMLTGGDQVGSSTLLLNPKYEERFVEVSGLLWGKKLFDRKLRPGSIQQDNWCDLGSFLAAKHCPRLYSLDFEVNVNRGEDGKIIFLKTTKTIGIAGSFKPSGALKGETLSAGSKLFRVDKLRVSSVTYYPQGLSRNQESFISQLLVSTQDISSLTVKVCEAF
ncbi:hypothetical protein [Rurimicrobium arvi]|uniref:Uncharacterized protein n=1 Tax=Rurimicrobium arvi TaxID=2049916 RepID=A0ABP8MXC9_9BACT